MKQVIEEALEEKQTVGVEVNYGISELDSIFDELISSNTVSDDIKKKLYFM